MMMSLIVLHFSGKEDPKKRDHLFWLNQDTSLIVSCFALLYIGAIPVIIDPGMGLKSLLNCIKRTKPKNLLTVPVIVDPWLSFQSLI